VRRLGLALLGVGATAWAVMLAFWPFGQIKPFRNPILAFQKFSNFWDTVTVLYDGQLLIARDLPRWYLSLTCTCSTCRSSTSSRGCWAG